MERPPLKARGGRSVLKLVLWLGLPGAFLLLVACDTGPGIGIPSIPTPPPIPVLPTPTPAPAPLALADATTIASVDTASVQGNGGSFSYGQSVSSDGRFVAFDSWASNLVPGDTNGLSDIFVRDRATGETTRVSVSSSGAQGNDESYSPSISSDGRFVAFYSYASNLVSGDTNARSDVFVHDRATRQTTRVSVSSSGAQGNSNSLDPSISSDGRHVAFTSWASNFVSDDLNGWDDVFVHDRQTANTSLVSVTTSGTPGWSYSRYPAISGNGRYVAFNSGNSNLVSGDTNNAGDIFVRDLQASSTTRVSVSSSGAQGNNGACCESSISATGRYVAFYSYSSNLVSGDTNETGDVFVRDRSAPSTTRVSVSSSGAQANNQSEDPSISADGRYVAFLSWASNLVSGDTNGTGDVFVRDRSGATTTRISVSSSGAQANNWSDYPSISADGRYVAFPSYATNLVAGDSNGAWDVFARHRDPTSAGSDARPGSDRAGLEDFYPYQRFEVGGGAAFVNMDSGNLVLQSTDLQVPGQGLPLELSRAYNATLDGQSGPLGPGWTLGVSGALEVRDQPYTGAALQLVLRDPDGTTHRFLKGGSASPGWHSPQGVSLTVTDHLDGAGRRYFRATRPDGLRYEFRPLGTRHYLTEMRDRRGNTLTFSYDALADGTYRLREVADVVGRKLTFTYTGTLLTQVRFTAGTQSLDTTYAYTSGRLASVTEAAGTASARTTTYAYGSSCASGALVCTTDPRGATTKVFGASAKVTKVTDRANKDWTFTWGGGTCTPPVGSDTKAACFTDPEGATEIWTTSPAGNLVHHRDAGDIDEKENSRRNDRRYEWAAHRLREETNEAGVVTETDYNAFGQTTETRRKATGEPTLVTRYSYQAPSGWPGASELTKVVAAAGSFEARTETFTYFSDGSVKSHTDPEGGVTSYTYYVRGLAKTVTDPGGHTTTYGDTALSDGGYHASGEASRLTDEAGATELFVYDFLGHQTQRTDRAGKVWTSEYDLRGNLTKEIDPLGGDTWHCFDQNDNEVLTILPNQSSPSCSLSETAASVTKTTYDPRDFVSSVLTSSDGQLRKTTFTYAADGELAETYGPRSFDGSGNLLPASEHQKTVRLYYANNRLKAEIDPTGAQTDYTYTPDGLTHTVTGPSNGAGRPSVTYTYTGRGEVRTEQRSGHEAPTLYTYNRHGEVVSVTTPSGATTRYEYDALGQVTKITDPLGLTSTRTYDANGNLVSLTQPTGAGEQLHTTYTYTPRGEIASESDPADAGHVVEYAYDPEGRQRFRYDRYNGTIERTIEQTFTDHGLLSGRTATGVGLPTHATTFTYDANGNLTGSATTLGGSALSSVSATYTTADETKGFTETISGVAKTSSYTYLTDGSLASRTIDGQTTTYAYDLAGREMGTAPWGGAGSFVTERHPSGDPKTLLLPNGGIQEQTYDLAGRLRSRVLSSSAGEVLSAWEKITYDGADNRTAELVTQRPAAAAALPRVGASTYTYDPASRLISAKHPFEVLPVPYALDDGGNILTDSSNRFAYEANRLKTRDPLPTGESTAYAHDHLGNITSETVGTASPTTITYDAASHTRRVTAPDGSWVEYAYDGWDRLVRRATSGGEVTLLFRDGVSESITLETDGAGVVGTRYVLDASGGPVAQDVTGAPARAYLVTDPRGNLTQLLDQSGGVVATFAYDAFGGERPLLTETSSSWDARLRFQLAPRDPGTGDYTIGPRVYDPGINRFVGVDFYVEASANHGLQLDSLTANRYMYAGLNPVNFVDDGHRRMLALARDAQSRPNPVNFVDDGHQSCTRIGNGYEIPKMWDFARGKVGAPCGFPYRPRKRFLRDVAFMVDPYGDGCSHFTTHNKYHDFRIPCGTHDYLYDILRFLNQKGRYGKGGRRDAADKALYRSAMWSCSGRVHTRNQCEEDARYMYRWVKRWTKWREGHGPPNGKITSS